jgi:glycosyltransferase involved in cell wall biosynthesis
LYIGDITWNKNLFNLGQAMLMTNIPLVLVGKALTNYNNLEHPEKAAFRSFLHLAKHNPQFIFLGYAPDDQLLSLYRRARLVVLPSYDEGFGLPWLEAALQKKPVVLSDLEIFREITNGQAQYFDPQNPEAIAKQIIMSYNHFDQTRIEKQYRLATTYSQENFIKNLAAAINSIS